MELSASAAIWFLPFTLPICIWAAWSDLARMKIPNRSALALLGVFAIVGLIALPFQDYLQGYLNGAIILAVTFCMTLLRLIGGGDAKFAAAIALFISPSDAMSLMMIFSVCALAGFATHRLARLTPLRNLAPNWESWTRLKDFPMGYPLGMTLVTYLSFAALS